MDRILKFLSLNICYVIYVLLWITYWLMWFQILLVFILFKFKKCPNISGIRVVCVCVYTVYIYIYIYNPKSEKVGTVWKMQHIVLQNLYVLFSINGAITEVQVTFAKGTDTTPYHDRPWLLDLLLVTVWMILFFFGPEHTASIPPQKYLKYWFIWPQYTFPLCDGPSQIPPSPEKSTALLDTVNIGLPFGTVQF